MYNNKRFGTPQIRVYHKKGTKIQCPRILLKCGDCDGKLEIYYNNDNTIEIGGVLGHIDDWKEILLPLLNRK